MMPYVGSGDDIGFSNGLGFDAGIGHDNADGLGLGDRVGSVAASMPATTVTTLTTPATASAATTLSALAPTTSTICSLPHIWLQSTGGTGARMPEKAPLQPRHATQFAGMGIDKAEMSREDHGY